MKGPTALRNWCAGLCKQTLALGPPNRILHIISNVKIDFKSPDTAHADVSHSVRAEDAERLLRKRLGEIATGAYRGIAVERTTLSELFDLVVADYHENGKRSIEDVLSRLKLHLQPRVGKLRAADFGSADVRRYKTTRKNEKPRPRRLIANLAF